MNSKEAEVQAKPLIIAHRLIFPTACRAPAAGWIDPKNLGKADHGRNFWKTHIIYITHPGNFEDSAHEKILKGQHMLIYYCGKKWGYYCRILHRCVESLPDWSHQPQIRWREVAWLPSLQLLYVGLVEKKKHQGNKHIMGLVSQYDVCFTLLREVLFCHLCLALWDAWPLEGFSNGVFWIHTRSFWVAFLSKWLQSTGLKNKPTEISPGV